MKVLFYESRPEWGGAQKCEFELIEGLESFGIETIFVTSTDGPMVERICSIGKKITTIPVHSKINEIRKDNMRTGLLHQLTLSLYFIPHYIKLVKFIIENKPDIIYTSQFRSQLLVGWVGKMLKKKVVWHIHGEEKLDNLLGKMALYTSDRVVVVSKKLSEQYANSLPKHKNKFIAVPNGVEINVNRQSNESGIIQLSTVGALLEGKRQDLSIQACKELIDKGYKVHLHIVGEKPHWHSYHYRNELLQLVEQNGLQSIVTFHGWVEKPYSLLSQSDIFLLPSDTEGLPLSIIEAMGVGLPCIATDVGGISELIIHGETGCLISKDSLEELVSAIISLIENNNMRVQMGNRAAGRYERHFTKKAFLEGVVGVLRTVQK